MKIALSFLMIIICFSSFAQKKNKFYYTTCYWQPSPSIDTIKLINYKPDTIAIFKTKDVICYTDGGVLFDYLKEIIKERANIDSSNVDEMKCLEGHQLDLDLMRKQLAKNDTIDFNQLHLEPSVTCGLYEDLIASNLTYSLFKVYSLKARKEEQFLIIKKVRKKHRVSYDQFKTADGTKIYKGTGTLGKY